MAETGYVQLLNGATATGDGAVTQTMFPVFAAAFQAEIFGSPTACQVNVMGLIDGGTYDTLAVLDISQGYVSGEIVTVPLPVGVRKLKGNVGALSGGTSPSVSLYAAWRH